MAHVGSTAQRSGSPGQVWHAPPHCRHANNRRPGDCMHSHDTLWIGPLHHGRRQRREIRLELRHRARAKRKGQDQQRKIKIALAPFLFGTGRLRRNMLGS